MIGAAIEVHRELGPGLLESVYQSCLEYELSLQKIECRPRHRLPLKYKGVELTEFFVIDFYFPSRLVVELKAVEKILGVHEAQLITYMKLTQTPVGLILNFNVPVLKGGIKRMVL